ncbi:hypothetical protein C8A00DRAFT_37289 [Chaetomidium leptoderma]|uniref:Uncharacterized protein n=1 Tax=Chaetomidium leptoderma TaxID=669021 RepID=A0AAN6ZTX8_9PEZI|nr:hypothetical protein C8A00DRAFT_37289 [Chaetomidium leptoderma]
MRQSAQSPAGLEPKASEKIPPLTNIASSIFVPLQDDILKSEPPRDRVERLHWILKTIDYQREGVKENLLYMFEREKRRVILLAAESEQAQGRPKIKPGLAPSEVDDIIANMESPAQPGMDYNIRTMAELGTNILIPPNASLRDKTVKELLIMVEKGLEELQDFERYMAGIKEEYLGCLEREMARIDNAGKRPEERSRVQKF